jgi:hypothetical protein
MSGVAAIVVTCMWAVVMLSDIALERARMSYVNGSVSSRELMIWHGKVYTFQGYILTLLLVLSLIAPSGVLFVMACVWLIFAIFMSVRLRVLVRREPTGRMFESVRDSAEPIIILSRKIGLLVGLAWSLCLSVLLLLSILHMIHAGTALWFSLVSFVLVLIIVFIWSFFVGGHLT